MDYRTSFGLLATAEKIFQYTYTMKPALNLGALFSDGTEFYRSPEEPMIGDSLRLRFRTAIYNVEQVFLNWRGERLEMRKAFSDQMFDYYEYTVSDLPDELCDYSFEIKAGRITCYYNKMGAAKDLNSYYNFQIAPGFTTPDWAKGAVFYQIFVDRFCNGDPSNDVLENEYSYIGDGTRQITDWGK